jgi:haloacid dehalogenase-like hydrolase
MSAGERVSAEAIRDGTDLEAGPRAEAVASLPPGTLPAESEFYRARDWCLDAFPTVQDVRRRLLGELESLPEPQLGWQGDEAAANVYLLSCALADSTDDHLAGERYDFSAATSRLPLLRPLTRALEPLLAAGRFWRARRLRALGAWRESWGSALDAVLQAWLDPAPAEPARAARARAALTELLNEELPAGLLCRRARVPAAFRSQDLTHHDILELAARFAAAFPDRERSLLVVGLRTAGSYFAPLVRAALALRGYQAVDVVTLRPKKGVAPSEQAALARCAAERGLALVVDEPPDTGRTMARGVDLLRRAGVAEVALLLPVHASRPDWNEGPESLPLEGIPVIALPPEGWYKRRLLEIEPIEGRMQEVFLARGYARVKVLQSTATEAFERRLRSLSDERFHTRLKRVYELRLQRRDGGFEVRYLLAKSVGWGWLAYHAFLAAERLAGFVPPLLGLRDGLLYVEWLPQGDAVELPRDVLVQRAAAYVAARVRTLRLDADPGPELDPTHQNGAELLAAALSGAYSGKAAAVLKRARLRHELTRRPCPMPTLIDGKLRLREWIAGAGSLLKTDFEHHALGKTELNVADPAYDLAEVVLHFGLSAAEEQALLRRYREASGDEGIEKRLFLHKLLAGTAAVRDALDGLKDPRLAHRHQEFSRTYTRARDFLGTQMARFCGRFCRIARPAGWGSPLVVMDVDGVVDKQVFGFPSTTAAGVQAVALLHAHGLPAALNSARTLAEVQEYCRDYGCVGGVAEYGSVVWDAVTGRTRVLVTPESRVELQRLGEALRRIPGVFLNEDYEHSLRAYAFEGGRTVPLPATLVHGVVAQLRLARVRVHQTFLDTALIAREVDKGKGLKALLRLVERPDLETIAIGDSEPDLAMFQAATRSWAPSHIAGRPIAQLLGCRIAPRSYQSGLLHAVRFIVHPDGVGCARCRDCETTPAEGLLWDLLKAADRRPMTSLLRALLDPMALRAFVK